MALDQSQACGDKLENDTIKNHALIGGETHLNANIFYKAIIFRQFPLQLELALAQKGLSNTNDSNVMSENFAQFDTSVEFQLENADGLSGHKTNSRNSKQDLDECDIKDPLLKGKLTISIVPGLMLCWKVSSNTCTDSALQSNYLLQANQEGNIISTLCTFLLVA